MPRRLIGLDIGSSTLRAVALASGRAGVRLQDAAEVSRYDDLGQRKPLARALNELDSRLPLRGRVAVASSGLTTLVRFEHNDPMPPERLARVLRLELAQHTEEGGDIAADAVTVPIDSDEVIHCCGLAQPAQVDELLAELKATGVAVERVDLAAAAASNAMRHQELDEDAEDAFGLIVDIGAATTRVTLCRGREFLACRQLPTGGEQFTEQLARARELRFEQAEAIKTGLAEAETQPGAEPAGPERAPDTEPLLGVDESAPIAVTDADLRRDSDPGAADAGPRFALDAEDETQPLDPGGDAAPPDPDALHLADDDAAALDPEAAPPPAWRRNDAGFTLEEPEIPGPGSGTVVMGGAAMGPELTRAAEALYAQVAKTVAWFQAQLRLSSLEIGWVRLAGGGAQLLGLQPYLRRRFGVPVEPLQPFRTLGDRVPLPAGAYAVAVGLALGSLDGGVRFDLRPERLQARALFWREVVWPRVAAGVLVAATAAIGVAMWLRRDAAETRFQAYDAQRQRHEQLLGQMRALRQQRDGMLTDLNAIASRIFGGRDLLYAIRACKQTAPEELWITTLDTVDPAATARRRLQADPGARRGGRGGRGDRGGRTAATGEEVRSNTLIDTVYVDGFMKPESGRSSTDLYAKFVQWYESLLAWAPENDAAETLFAAHEVIWFDDKRESADAEGRYRFEIKFLLRPTEWEEIAQLVPEAP